MGPLKAPCTRMRSGATDMVGAPACRRMAPAFAYRRMPNVWIRRLIEHWLVCHEQFERDRPFLQHVHVLRYEDFVARPQDPLKARHSFLGHWVSFASSKRGTPLATRLCATRRRGTEWRPMGPAQRLADAWLLGTYPMPRASKLDAGYLDAEKDTGPGPMTLQRRDQ
jgi:hypothetical protein